MNQFLCFNYNINLEPKQIIAHEREEIIEYAVFSTKGFSENIMNSQERTKEIL